MIPKVGNSYRFFDDGKLTRSRMYIATVIDVVPFDKAKDITVDTNGYWHITSMSLVNAWEIDTDKEESWSVFANTTDYFIGCSIPEYDKHTIWFARTKDNGWFSFNIQSNWQSGRLDVTGELYKQIHYGR